MRGHSRKTKIEMQKNEMQIPPRMPVASLPAAGRLARNDNGGGWSGE